jgi:hypothetical protein
VAKRAKRKDPIAVALGHKGGKATAKHFTPKERTEAARKAARARWAPPTVSLSLRAIRLKFQAKDHLDQSKVKTIAAAMAAGEPVEPVIVYYDGKVYRLFDGFHRVAAAKSVHWTEIEAEIRTGGEPEMQAEWERGLSLIKADNARWMKEHTARR